MIHTKSFLRKLTRVHELAKFEYPNTRFGFSLIYLSFFDIKAERKYIFIEQKNYKKIRTGVQNGGVLWN